MQVAAYSQDDVNLFDFWKFYSDAENSMYKTSCSIAFKQLNERELEIGQLHSKKDYLERQELVKEKLLRLMGPFPEKTPLNARITGVIKKADYKVEKVIYESLPGFYVTASLFLPKKRKGKTPAIIYASGHTKNGFRSETYQHIIINLVKKGFIVLAFDPIGQGERLQYYNEEEGKSPFGPTIEHSYPGAQCYIAGYSPTKYFVWDAIRAVDYLISRKEVDPKRIGMTGRSGGGTQTAYTAALDDRILAAAPECFITNMEYVLKTIGPQDAEQNLIHMISEGLDHADLMEVRAPKPALMITTTRDFFSIQGARETFIETKEFYKKLGYENNITMVEDDDIHTSTKKNREAMYAFFQKYLELPGSAIDMEVELFDEKELWSTKTGQLATFLKSETIFSLNKKVVESQVAALNERRSIEKNDKSKSALIEDVKNLSGFEYPIDLNTSVFSGRYVFDNYVLEKYLISGSADYMIPIALFKPIEYQNNEIVMILEDKGMEQSAKDNSDLVHKLLKQGYNVLLYDVTGIGSLGSGYLKGDAYIDNTSYNLWFAGNLTNKSIVAMRAEDIIKVVSFIESENKNIKSISAISFGASGSELLHAAIFDNRIQKIGLIRPIVSFAEIALSFKYSASSIPSTVAGAIEKYDLPDLMAAVCPRKLMIVQSQAASNKNDEKGSYLSYPMDVYTEEGFHNNWTYIIEKESMELNKQIMVWLN